MNESKELLAQCARDAAKDVTQQFGAHERFIAASEEVITKHFQPLLDKLEQAEDMNSFHEAEWEHAKQERDSLLREVEELKTRLAKYENQIS